MTAEVKKRAQGNIKPVKGERNLPWRKTLLATKCRPAPVHPSDSYFWESAEKLSTVGGYRGHGPGSFASLKNLGTAILV